MKAWIEDLIDEYPTKRSDGAIVRLARVFRGVPDSTMQAAVDSYMLSGQQFFPKVSDLAPYVREAQEQARGPEPYAQVKRVRYGRWLGESGEYHSDEEILRWEQARGTMPADNLLDTEWDCNDPPEWNESEYQRILSAYGRIRTGASVGDSGRR